MRNKKVVYSIFAATLLGMTGASAAAEPKIIPIPQMDKDNNFQISIDEFLDFRGNAYFTELDGNKDGSISLDEWLGPRENKFRKDMAERFNKNRDDVMSVKEIANMVKWMFNNRDWDKNKNLIGEEIPKAFRFEMPTILPVKSADTDNNYALSLDEYVLFAAERDLKWRDKNKDEILSYAEWVGPNTDKFKKLAYDKFNLDGDEIMSASEIVEVYVWIFGNKDSNKDGLLKGDEIPKNLRMK